MDISYESMVDTFNTNNELVRKYNKTEKQMRNILKYILSAFILFGSVPTLSSMDMNRAGMEEIKKKKKS